MIEMIGFLVLLFPPLLLVFMLFMGKVEEPLNRVNTEREIEKFLDDANPDELDTFVREGTDSALHRFRQRLSLHRLLPASSRRRPR
jgi:Na+-transporting methylmalonyl-CoA/oxaloacetate decarboxylase gamma subunit